MSYERRTASTGWLMNDETSSFRESSKRFASRMKAEAMENVESSKQDDLDKDLQMTASRVLAYRKAAEERRASAQTDETPFKGTETLFEDETSNSVARTKADLGPCKIHIGNEANGGDPSVSLALKKIVAHLDRIASYCEENGQKELASQIDMISNTIEKEEKDND